jgi:hypothetical protein
LINTKKQNIKNLNDIKIKIDTDENPTDILFK